MQLNIWIEGKLKDCIW